MLQPHIGESTWPDGHGNACTAPLPFFHLLLPRSETSFTLSVPSLTCMNMISRRKLSYFPAHLFFSFFLSGFSRQRFISARNIDGQFGTARDVAAWIHYASYGMAGSASEGRKYILFSYYRNIGSPVVASSTMSKYLFQPRTRFCKEDHQTKTFFYKHA